jgi:hypothetical protein
MVLSGDVPSDCNLSSFRQARFFDFFNEIGYELSSSRDLSNDRASLVCCRFEGERAAI